MKLTILDEPPLEFANGARHIDPRHGLTDYGPVDVANAAFRELRVGLVGTAQALDGLKRWLDRARRPIDPKASRLGSFYCPWPGCDDANSFRSHLTFDSRLERVLRERDLADLTKMEPREAVNAAVALYGAELEALSEEPSCDVVLVARPDDLPERCAPEDEAEDHIGPATPIAPTDNFRTRLKAVSLRYGRPIQLIRRSTWDADWKGPKTEPARTLQDEATRAWNLHTALYYKAGGVPWRLPKTSTDLTSCYVGITFYRSSDDKTLQTSVAQVFNQRGDGVIVRGGPASVSRHDRQPHLSADDAQKLLSESLRRYRAEHRTVPARLVLHKTSSYTDEERSGFCAAAEQASIDMVELLWLPASEPIKLFRDGEHPPLRGTMLSLNAERHLLYSRGSVPFYRTYPGMYVPAALSFRSVLTESSPEVLATELLALTKMNWNQTQMDGRLPITIRTADRVGEILRLVGPEVQPQGRYAFYM